MREEYLANVSAFEEKIPDLLTNRLRIEKMSTSKVKEAITGPCNYAEIGIENEAVETIIEKLTRQGKTIELTYLQVLLDRLFHKAAQEQKGDNLQFTQSLVTSLGEVSDILGDFLEEQIRQFDNPDQVLDVLKSFVSIRGTKRQSIVEEIGNHLLSLNKKQDKGALQDIIQQLVNIRILREKDENGRYELRHDALAVRIYEKISLVERELIEVRQYIETAYENYLKRGSLLKKEDISYISIYLHKLYLKKEYEDFYELSKKRIAKHRRRQITGIVFASAVVVISLFSIVIYRWQVEREQKERLEKILEHVTVIVTAEKMNVLYAGIPNPITVGIPGLPCNRIEVSAEDALIKNTDNPCRKLVIPEKVGKIHFNFKGQRFEEGPFEPLGQPVEFRVKYLPPPNINIDGNYGPYISKEDLLNSKGIGADYPGFGFDLTSKVDGFTISFVQGGWVYESRSNSGEFNEKQIKLINEISIHDSVKLFIENAKVRTADKREMELKPKLFIVTD